MFNYAEAEAEFADRLFTTIQSSFIRRHAAMAQRAIVLPAIIALSNLCQSRH
jgi:hypothetical protein